jgi:thiamine kinase-like enzyme
VLAYLRDQVQDLPWAVELPPGGTGKESYFARHEGRSHFIKLGVQVERYRILAELGLSPRIVASGQLADGTPVLVQERVPGRMPSRKDFRENWQAFAAALRLVHASRPLQSSLTARSSARYADLGRECLEAVAARWEAHRARVPEAAGEVDRRLDDLRLQVSRFRGEGLVASHNDVCNGNWLLADDGRLYLLDYDSMTLDDPAQDLGAILWWYYPPEMRADFIRASGVDDGPEFRLRMQVRMAIHCLNILLPRPGSFDRFDAAAFAADLVDFHAAAAGRENPQGYGE